MDVASQNASLSPEGHPPQIERNSLLLKQKDYILGIVLLMVVVLLWTSSNFVTQDIFDGGYEKPFLVTYLNTGAFTFYLLPCFVRWVIRLRHFRGVESARLGYEPIAVSDGLEVSTSTLQTAFMSSSILTDDQISMPNRSDDLSPLSFRDTAKLASVFCLFWFVANWGINASLRFTSVASATILSSMSGFFTLIVGRIFKVEALTLTKVGAVITSFLGVVFVSVSDSASAPVVENPGFPPSTLNSLPSESNHFANPILGDSLALIGALFYALYVILLKVRIKEESRIDMQLFFGFVGIFNLLFLWPIGLVLHLTGAELLDMPQGRRAWAGVLANMAITLSSDYLYVLAMLKTTPLVVTVGLSLTIPLAIIGDFFLNVPTAPQAVFGAGLVVVSFVVIGMENSKSPLSAEVKSGQIVNIGLDSDNLAARRSTSEEVI